MRLLLLVVFTAGLSGLSATQAPSAAAACSGSGCSGLDPASHCSATSAPQEMFIDGEITLQLRYASACRAFWGRAVADKLWRLSVADVSPGPAADLQSLRLLRHLCLLLRAGLVCR
jgi:hypothetical protein